MIASWLPCDTRRGLPRGGLIFACGSPARADCQPTIASQAECPWWLITMIMMASWLLCDFSQEAANASLAQALRAPTAYLYRSLSIASQAKCPRWPFVVIVSASRLPCDSSQRGLPRGIQHFACARAARADRQQTITSQSERPWWLTIVIVSASWLPCDLSHRGGCREAARASLMRARSEAPTARYLSHHRLRARDGSPSWSWLPHDHLVTSHRGGCREVAHTSLARARGHQQPAIDRLTGWATSHREIRSERHNFAPLLPRCRGTTAPNALRSRSGGSPRAPPIEASMKGPLWSASRRRERERAGARERARAACSMRRVAKTRTGGLAAW